MTPAHVTSVETLNNAILGSSKRVQAAFFALFALVALSATVIATPLSAKPAPESFADLAEELLPTVVNISSTTKRSANQGGNELEEMFREFFNRRGPSEDNDESPFPRDRRRSATSLGSGFVIDASGFIVTNNHVIEDADQVAVTMHDGTEFEAEIVGRDPRTDLAVLKIEPGDYELKATVWGDSDVLRVGDWMIAIGNPFGLGNTVTAGIVSAKSRNINSGPYDSFIQTDASINRGNSGGPSFNLAGEVIGVNTAIYSPSGGSVGIGFAIPSEIAQSIVSQLVDGGKVRRGWLGVRFGEVDQSTAALVGLDSPVGAVVNQVMPDSPAEAGGVEPGDVILSWGDTEIANYRDLPLAVAETPVDATVTVVVWRDGQEVELAVTVGELDEEVVAANSRAKEKSEPDTDRKLAEYGLILDTLTLDQRREAGLPAGEPGVLVKDVDTSSNFARKGLSKGDIIAEINDEKVESPDEVLEIFEKVKADGFNIVALSVFKDGRYRWMAVELD